MAGEPQTAQPGISLAGPGRMVGTPIVASVRAFEQKYGRAAVADVVSRLPEQWRELVHPNREACGLLGARWYPYAFIADWVTVARTVVRMEEDAFIRELAIAGIDGSMSTVMRAMVRWFTTPKAFAERSQESWRLFHDTGIVTVPTIADKEVRRRVTEWQGHNVIVCKVAAEVFARTFSKTGVRNARVTREECIAWGRDACTFRIQWD